MGLGRPQDGESSWIDVCWCRVDGKCADSLTIAALNGVDVCATDIRNAYLQAPSSRKDYIICGVEFGFEHEGKVSLIILGLY